MRFFRRRWEHGPHSGPERRRIPLIFIVLMLIGLMTVLYFLIVYGLIPVLAMLTPA